MFYLPEKSRVQQGITNFTKYFIVFFYLGTKDNNNAEKYIEKVNGFIVPWT